MDVQRQTKERELERQYNAMAAACETLRLIDDSGLTAEEAEKIGATRKEGVMGRKGNEEGRLYRIAMMKDDVWDGVPIEYARMQVETPGREGWNHAWTR
jgi:large subunit ribosomal protein L40